MQLGLPGLGEHLGTPIDDGRAAVNVTGCHEPIDKAGEIAVRHHHPLGKIGQHHALGRLVELRHEVEARKRDVELLTQAAAQLAFDESGAGKKTQPQPQLVSMVSSGISIAFVSASSGMA